MSATQGCSSVSKLFSDRHFSNPTTQGRSLASELFSDYHSFKRIFSFTARFRLFLGGHFNIGFVVVDSQLSESNLPRTHTVVWLNFKGIVTEVPNPQTVVANKLVTFG
jgi:hypothetical protein